MLTVGDNLTALPFGFPDRTAVVLRLADSAPGLHPYVPLVRLADRLTRGARTPYDAVEKLEQWFVSSGAFRYSNHPPIVGPPLVGFVTRTHAGYCQYFAGSMALMLRYLGDPRPGRGRLRRRNLRLEAARLERQRPRGARLGRGLVQGLRLAPVRPDAGRSRRRATRDARRCAGGRRDGNRAVGPVGGRAELAPRRSTRRRPSRS